MKQIYKLLFVLTIIMETASIATAATDEQAGIILNPADDNFLRII